jgi:3-phosphoshikimate 1-carboxyvinyltransferase
MASTPEPCYPPDENSMKRFRIRPSGPLRGEARVPGDKSIGHRALIFASLAEGESRINGLSGGLDNLATADAFRAMGIDIRLHANAARVAGKGLRGLTAPKRALDCGNSGTTMRLLAGILVAQRFPSKLIGDESLTRRPMGRVIEPLRERGAHLDGSPGAKKGVLYPPLHIQGLRGGESLRAIDYTSPVASAQVKSALLLSGLYADGPTRVLEPGPSRDHTERMLAALGVSVQRDGLAVTLDPSKGKLRWRGFDLRVPGDPSSAAFAIVAAAIVPGSEVSVRGVCVNETRTGFLDVAERMGLPVEIREEDGGASGERVATIVARHAASKATEIEEEALVVRLIDEIPVLSALAAVAEGTTRIRGAGELRVKESDRIAVMVKTLRAFGVECEEHPDGMDIVGGSRLRGATVESHHDHRIAMTGALLGMIAEGETVVNDTDCVGTSFPSFVSLFRDLGADIVEEEA